MRKAHIALIVVALMFVVGVVPVQAQGVLGGGYMPDSPEGWYYYLRGDRVHMLQADNIEYVRRTMNIGRNAQFRRVTDDMVGHDSYVGVQGPRGFYPMYQCSSVKRRVMNGVGKTMVAAGVGYLAGRFINRLGEREGAIAGAGIGAGWALMKDAQCAPVQNQMVVIDDPSDLGDDDSDQSAPRTRGISGRENGWNEILRAWQERGNDGASWFRSSQGDCLDLGMFTLKNETGEVIRVYKDGNPYAVLKPLGVACGNPFAAYDAEMVVAISDNFTARAGTPRAKPEGRSGGLWIWR